MADTLQDNEKLARVRLESLRRRLARDNSDLAGRYDSVLQDMENERIIEEVPAAKWQLLFIAVNMD